jgi:hypothetical protein
VRVAISIQSYSLDRPPILVEHIYFIDPREMWCLVYYHYIKLKQLVKWLCTYKDQFCGYLFHIVIDYG